LDIKHEYKPGQGIDFYVDAARYLPDSVTVSRLLVRGINNKQEKTFTSAKAYPDIVDSTRQIQSYDFRMEIRPEAQLKGGKTKIDPTTFIELIVETIDRQEMSEKIIGFAYFPLFLTKDAEFPPYESTATQYIYNQGAY
jgi:hypothetical protein